MKLFNLFKIGINKYIRKWLTCALKIRFTKKEFFANHLNIKEFNLFQPESTDYTVDYRDIFSQQGTRNWEGGGGGRHWDTVPFFRLGRVCALFVLFSVRLIFNNVNILHNCI